MRRQPPVLALALAFVLVLTPSALGAPTGASAVEAPEGRLLHWVGPDDETLDADVSSNETASLWLEFLPADAERSWNGTVAVGFAATAADGTTHLVPRGNVTFATVDGAGGVEVPIERFANVSGDLSVEYNATVTLTDGNATTTLFAVGTYRVAAPAEAPAPAPTLPRGAYIAGALVLLGVLVAGVVVGRQRAQRRRMNEGPRRSQVMRELELEQKLEKAKDPEQVQEIKQEIRQQEHVREKRRELQILEAKRADALKTLDLLKKRHEAGGLTKLQYDNMVAKKRGDLQKIEADIAQMEAEDAGGAAAS